MTHLLSKKPSTRSRDIHIARRDLIKHKLDAGGRDFLIAFNEPAFKFSQHGLPAGDLDSKLNARLPSYFLPLVTAAKKQSFRPRLYVVSGLNMALKWNAQNEYQRKVMTIDNNLKMDFIQTFFERFFYDDFSAIEYIVSQDPIKVSDAKLFSLWRVLERRYPLEVEELKLTLAKYKRPKLFNGKQLSEEAKEFLSSQDEELMNAFKYAVSHLFVMADINFEGNYIHNPIGYLTVGAPTEKVFNTIRDLALRVLEDIAELVFEREVIYKDNIRLIISTQTGAPAPYNGSFESFGTHKQRLTEVTYENEEPLDFYDGFSKLKPDMEYIYEFIPEEQYKKFWDSYKTRYFELKKRYREAYKLNEDF
jgi:hypothetical protein